MKTAYLSLAAFAAAAGVVVPASAADTLQVVSGTKRAVQIQYFGPVGQTFTAFSDTITSVGFQFGTINSGSANVPIGFNLYAGETLTGSALFSGEFDLPSNDLSSPTWFDLALPNIAVTQGQTYSLVLNSTSARSSVYLGPDYNIYTGQAQGPDAYADGHAFASKTLYPNCTGASNDCDLNFRVTGDLVASAVPEPASWALMILGFGAVGGMLRKRRRQQFTLSFV